MCQVPESRGDRGELRVITWPVVADEIAANGNRAGDRIERGPPYPVTRDVESSGAGSGQANAHKSIPLANV